MHTSERILHIVTILRCVTILYVPSNIHLVLYDITYEVVYVQEGTASTLSKIQVVSQRSKSLTTSLFVFP
jgi:ABC-type histidine transport system ATPase subunit